LNAARILSRAALDTDHLSRELGPVRLEDVNIWPAAKGIRLLWRSGVRGITLWRLVVADPRMFDEDPDRLARFVIHELVHLRQFAELGYFRFMFRYLREYLQGRFRGQDHPTAYLAISAEEEAREFANRYV
jgi:hypothetical protein